VLGGLALGTTGVALLTLGADTGGASFERVALVLAALAWAAGSLHARHGARPASAAQATAMQLAAGGVIVLAISAATGELSGFEITATSPRALISLLFLVLGGTVAGFAAYTWLLRVTSAAAVGSYAFVNPVIAVGLAWAVGDEAASAITALAGILVVSAVLLLGGWLRLPSWRLVRTRVLGAPAAPCESLQR
jgi:drug/metabolite transporter (DMT)-like permease